ncbi:MAG: ribonuclease HI [Anaerolineae bacterium]|nr:ribonuclease HI [Anaerolineae bacterium]
MKQVTIYTDGSCKNNPGPGGWAAILVYGEHEKELEGGDSYTTNNQMELTAAIKALEAIKEPCEVELFTDSEYLVKGMTEWLDGWKRKSWRTRRNEEVRNKQLWQQLDRIASKHQVKWNWIKGHDGHKYNERCDALARKQIEKYSSVPRFQVGDQVWHEDRVWQIMQIEDGRALIRDTASSLFSEEKWVVLYALSLYSNGE